MGLINGFEGFEVIRIFKNGQELVSFLEAGGQNADVILLDVRMPVIDGIQTMAWLKDRYPE